MTPYQITRRRELAWLLKVAETCPDYARRAAREREKLAQNHGVPALFRGLADRFDVDWSALQQAKKEVDHA